MCEYESISRSIRVYFIIHTTYKLNSVALVRKQTIPTELPAKLLPIFADRRCRVVSATDPYGR
jgi:hypothetical protein